MVQSSSYAAEAIVSPSNVQILTNFRGWVLSVLPEGWQAIQGQQNQSALPLDRFVIFTPITRRRLATNGWTYGDAARSVSENLEITIQVSAFGTGAQDAIQALVILFRDFEASDWMRANGNIAAPLYASEPRNLNFVNDSNQYESAWSADFRLNVCVTTTIPQAFASSATITTIEANAAS